MNECSLSEMVSPPPKYDITLRWVIRVRGKMTTFPNSHQGTLNLKSIKNNNTKKRKVCNNAPNPDAKCHLDHRDFGTIIKNIEN